MVSATSHRTTERVLDILELISSRHDGLTFSEISHRMEIPKGSLFPLLQTLCKRRYILYQESLQKYFLGESLFILGNKFVDKVDILDRIRDVMQELAFTTKETTYFGVRSGGDVLYLLKNEPLNTIRVAAAVGYKLSAYGTGLGKALLCHLSLEELKTLYPKLTPITHHTITEIETLALQCEEIRKTGFAYEKEESTPDIQCIAVNIQVNGKVLAGVSTAVPIYRYTTQKEEEIKTALLCAKKAIEQIISENRIGWTYS